jgi:putative ABC transport system permease protein
MLGVALAFSVALINASALSEFSQAVRSVNGQPDLELRAVRGGFDERPVRARGHRPRRGPGQPGAGAVQLRWCWPHGTRVALRIVGRRCAGGGPRGAGPDATAARQGGNRLPSSRPPRYS